MKIIMERLSYSRNQDEFQFRDAFVPHIHECQMQCQVLFPSMKRADHRI
eukprot:COSAG01_NODE_17753_length_1126_cov_6.136319_2_plen_48_part_01